MWWKREIHKPNNTVQRCKCSSTGMLEPGEFGMGSSVQAWASRSLPFPAANMQRTSTDRITRWPGYSVSIWFKCKMKFPFRAPCHGPIKPKLCNWWNHKTHRADFHQDPHSKLIASHRSTLPAAQATSIVFLPSPTTLQYSWGSPYLQPSPTTAFGTEGMRVGYRISRVLDWAGHWVWGQGTWILL